MVCVHHCFYFLCICQSLWVAIPSQIIFIHFENQWRNQGFKIGASSCPYRGYANVGTCLRQIYVKAILYYLPSWHFLGCQCMSDWLSSRVSRLIKLEICGDVLEESNCTVNNRGRCLALTSEDAWNLRHETLHCANRDSCLLILHQLNNGLHLKLLEIKTKFQKMSASTDHVHCTRGLNVSTLW